MQIQNAYLTHNRPRTIRKQTTAIAVHWVANPGSSAMANRNYFNSTSRSVSSNYIVGLQGEVICCIPDEEMSWCTNAANSYTVSIETCHPDWTGAFGSKTYASLVELTAQLCRKYGLHPQHGGADGAGLAGHNGGRPLRRIARAAGGGYLHLPLPGPVHAQGLHQLHVLDFPGIGQQAGPTAAAGEGQGGQAGQQQGCYASHF